MRTDTAPTPTLLADYKPFDFTFDSVALEFELDPSKTIVTSTMAIRRTGDAKASLELNGEAIDLISVKIDGKVLPRKAYQLTQTHLVLKDVPDAFELTIINSCAPKDNSQLMGLYVSGGRFCTQCEAEGYRRITYFADRPDVLSIYTVRMSADKAAYPTLLANGNKTDSGDLPGGKHYAVWEDPFAKPCYLFAMVAGEFDQISDSFKTMSGRTIPLEIYVDPGDAPRAAYAMDALKRSMAWDETAFGREYDLDLFMIVAVRDFNFGAMENKGLNIFNSVLLLADAQTATDLNFQRIESVVAHEYFHNWTGNRITCRDWFQLCLKEGFTVFRDQEFSADQRGAALQRIKDVKTLRARQFPEDAGPLAHAVRPSSYLKIDNFYTATIYEKGAEIIRMLKTLLGDSDFRKGCDLYFETLDGTAATVEEFVACFEKATGKDLSRFMTWYSQAGTPHLNIATTFNQGSGEYEIKLNQKTPPTPGQARKAPLLMPISVALIGEDGNVFGEQTFAFSSEDARIKVPNLKTKPTLSVLRKFSAPVVLHMQRDTADILRQMRFDTDLFNRWEAGQGLARELLATMARAIETGQKPPEDLALRGYARALNATLNDPTITPGFKALALGVPTHGEILQTMEGADPVAISEAITWLHTAIADYSRDDLLKYYSALADDGPFSPDADSAGRRALRNSCLSLLATRPSSDIRALARAQFDAASNMTDEFSAFITLMFTTETDAEQASTSFYEKWKDNPLVIDKWFSVQSMRPGVSSLSSVQAAIDHPAYEPSNPNRVRALVGGFAASNPKSFHAHDGSGYRFFTDQVMDMDKRNPGIAARLLGVFEIWTRLDSQRQALVKEQLKRVIASKPSKNVLEIASKALG